MRFRVKNDSRWTLCFSFINVIAAIAIIILAPRSKEQKDAIIICEPS